MYMTSTRRRERNVEWKMSKNSTDLYVNLKSACVQRYWIETKDKSANSPLLQYRHRQSSLKPEIDAGP